MPNTTSYPSSLYRVASVIASRLTDVRLSPDITQKKKNVPLTGKPASAPFFFSFYTALVNAPAYFQ